MKAYVIAGAVFVFTCVLQYALHAAQLAFSFTLQKPVQRDIELTQRVSVRIQFTISDPEKLAEQSAVALMAGKPLSVDEHVDALKWLLSRSQFVLAERHALVLVQKTRSNHVGALITLAFSKVCRGDYEAACKTFELLDTNGGPISLRPWYVYLKSTTLGAAEGVEGLARKFITSGEINVNPMAMTAVLATCTGLRNGEALFRMLEKSTNASALAKDEDNRHAFAELQSRYGDAE